jgi:hypothetical protein
LQASGGFRIVTVPVILVKSRRRSVNSRYLVEFFHEIEAPHELIIPT